MRASLVKYFLRNADGVLRSSRGCLPFNYLVPGGIYGEELWDWDTWWLSKGLLNLLDSFPLEKRPALLDHIEGSLKDFFATQGENGKIPILSTPEKQDVFGCVSDPTHERNQAKPVLAQLALEICKAKNDFRWFAPYFPSLLKFLDSWWQFYLAPCALLVWGGDTAIGVDNDPTTYGRPEFSSASLFLNCLYYQDISAAVLIARKLEDAQSSELLERRAAALKEAIQAECWDPGDGFYYTVDVQCRDMRDKFIPKEIPRGMDMNWRTLPLKIKVFTGFLPMWCRIATAEQARILVERHLSNPDEFDAPCGVTTLAKNEKMYAPEIESGNPSNWLGPIWIIANYLVCEGLCNYGFHQEAARLADKTIRLLARDLEQTGALHECYHPDTGKPNFNAGFLSWNILAALLCQNENGASSMPIAGR